MILINKKNAIYEKHITHTDEYIKKWIRRR